MSLSTAAIAEARFDKLSDVQNWISESKDHLDRVSINGVLENGAEFVDDEYLGDGDTMLRFNDRGIRALCRLVGFRFDQLEKLETPSLATAVMNDLLQQQDIRSKLAEMEFVVDNRSMTVIGVVSESYVSYDNHRFLQDLQQFLDSVKGDEPSEFEEAYVVNTELTVRFCSTKRHGDITLLGGRGPDRSKLGMEFHNSMVGTSSVRVNFFLHRLVCANGMMVPAGESVSRIHHSGSPETFDKRLKHRFGELLRKLDSLKEMLQTLGAMPLQAERLVTNNEINKQLFEVIPATKRTICDGEKLQLVYPANATTEQRNALRIEHDTKIAQLIPQYFGREHSKGVFGSNFRNTATVFDLINVFTEYAKSEPPSQRLEIEERSGKLAKYISDNKKKL